MATVSLTNLTAGVVILPAFNRRLDAHATVMVDDDGNHPQIVGLARMGIVSVTVSPVPTLPSDADAPESPTAPEPPTNTGRDEEPGATDQNPAPAPAPTRRRRAPKGVVATTDIPPTDGRQPRRTTRRRPGTSASQAT